MPAEAGRAEASQAVRETLAWVEGFVVALDLCPFAGAVLAAGGLHVALCESEDPEVLLRALADEMLALRAADPEERESTLLLHPNALRDFLAYNDFLDVAEGLLVKLGLEGTLQLVSFHPGYCFAGVPADDPANATNRSPHPMLHLLREESVSPAVAAHPDPGAIPARNERLLREMGPAEIEHRLAALREAAR